MANTQIVSIMKYSINSIPRSQCPEECREAMTDKTDNALKI